jgi:hypothetical protein
MSTSRALLLAGIVFIVTLLARLPARALLPLLPAGTSCQTPTGTVWQGSCSELHVPRVALMDVSWTVHPAALLGLRLSADVASDDPRAVVRAAVTLSRGARLQLRAVTAQLPLQGGLPGIFPSGLSGQVQVAIDSATLDHNQLIALQGSVRVLQLRSESQAADLGSFELLFPPAAQGDPIDGRLRDLGGPLSVSGDLRLMRAGGYDLSGYVAARPQASADVVQALQLLGPPDAQGRRMFSLAGSL